jgi:hypothetical protein
MHWMRRCPVGNPIRTSTIFLIMISWFLHMALGLAWSVLSPTDVGRLATPALRCALIRRKSTCTWACMGLRNNGQLLGYMHT